MVAVPSSIPSCQNKFDCCPSCTRTQAKITKLPKKENLYCRCVCHQKWIWKLPLRRFWELRRFWTPVVVWCRVHCKWSAFKCVWNLTFPSWVLYFTLKNCCCPSWFWIVTTNFFLLSTGVLGTRSAISKCQNILNLCEIPWRFFTPRVPSTRCATSWDTKRQKVRIPARVRWSRMGSRWGVSMDYHDFRIWYVYTCH